MGALIPRSFAIAGFRTSQVRRVRVSGIAVGAQGLALENSSRASDAFLPAEVCVPPQRLLNHHLAVFGGRFEQKTKC